MTHGVFGGLPISKITSFLAWIALALALSAVLRATGFYQWTATDSEGLSVVIQLIGAIYSVLLAFTVFVIWGQFNDVENCVVRESDSIIDLLRFSRHLNSDAHAEIRRALSNYTRQVLISEWPKLGDGVVDKKSEEAFLHFVDTVVKVELKVDTESAIHERLLDMSQELSRNRDERLAKSLLRVPRTLLGLVNAIAGALMLLVFLYPFHAWLAGLVSIVVLSFVLLLANFVIIDTDNPIKGVWNVTPKAFADLHL